MTRSRLLGIAAATVVGGGGLTTLLVFLGAPVLGVQRGLVYLLLFLGSLLALPFVAGVTDLAYDSGLGTSEGFALTDSNSDPNVETGSIPNQFVLISYCVGVCAFSLGMLFRLS